MVRYGDEKDGTSWHTAISVRYVRLFAVSSIQFSTRAEFCWLDEFNNILLCSEEMSHEGTEQL